MVLTVLGPQININSYLDIFLIMEKSFLKGTQVPPFPSELMGKIITYIVPVFFSL